MTYAGGRSGSQCDYVGLGQSERRLGRGLAGPGGFVCVRRYRGEWNAEAFEQRIPIARRRRQHECTRVGPGLGGWRVGCCFFWHFFDRPSESGYYLTF
jgi:hypothetical protein